MFSGHDGSTAARAFAHAYSRTLSVGQVTSRVLFYLRVSLSGPGSALEGRVFHQIEFSTLPSLETYKNKYLGQKFDVELEFKKKMTNCFSDFWHF